MELTDFIELVGQRLGVSLQFKAEDVRKSVSLRLQDPVTDDELWNVLTSVLEGQGLVIVEAEHRGLYRIVPVQRAAAENQQLVVGDTAGAVAAEAGQFASFVSVLTRLESLSPEAAATAAKPLLTTPGGAVTAIGQDGLILITDVRRRVEQVMDLLSLLDGPPDPIVSFVVDLEHLRAGELSDYLERVAAARLALEGGLKRGSEAVAQASARLVPLPDPSRALVVVPQSREAEIRTLISELDRREPSLVHIYPVSRVPLDELAAHLSSVLAMNLNEAASRPEPGVARSPGPSTAGDGRIYVDRLTGSLHIRATPAEHTTITAIIEQIEAAGPVEDIVIRSFVARNRDAETLVGVISELVGAGPLEAPLATEPAAAAAAEATAQPPRRVVLSDNRPISLSVDTATNTILAVGPRVWMRQIEELITQLDQRQPQVMIEVTLVTLSEGEALDFGVELAHQFTQGSTEVNLASLFGLRSGDGMGTLASGTGFTGLVINPGDFEVVVRALQAVNVGRSVSTPRMLVDNHATSTLRSVVSEPFTSLNASDTVATTSFGGTQDAGTTVTVTPHIGAGDHLSLEYAVELSAFTGQSTSTEGGGVIPPPSQQNTLDGSVTIPDDYTVVIGGIRNTSDGRSTNRVPLLGQIPILGALFGTTSESDSESRFYVFIRASILRDQLFEGLRAASARELEQAGIDDGLPTLEPLWID